MPVVENSKALADQFERFYEDSEQPLSPMQHLRALIVSTPAVEGLDINRFQRGEVLDPAAIYESGRRFIILEATWGLWVPPSFAEFWPSLLDAGFLMLAYGFFRGDQSGSAQADLLLETVRPMYEAQGFWMPLFSDVERFTGDTATVTQRRTNWRAWVEAIRAEVRPGVYSNIPSWQTLMNNESVADDLVCWPAHYADTTEPLLPPGWRAQIHQYGVATKYPWCPSVPGMADDVDVDRAYMTLEELRALGEPVAPEPPPPPEEPPDMATILENAQRAHELTQQLRTQFLVIYQELNPLLAEIESQAANCNTVSEPPPSPPPPPPPVEEPSVIARITREPKAVSQYSLENNPSGNPIMEPYPRGGDTSQRITFLFGSTVKVAASKVQGNGGRFWKLIDHKGRADETLYLKEDDANKV